MSGSALLALTGFAIERWHNVELPEVRSPRADMIGESAAGGIVHVELQSTNDADMALRMAEYALALHRRFGQFPQQVVLYLGKAPLRMPESIADASKSHFDAGSSISANWMATRCSSVRIRRMA